MQIQLCFLIIENKKTSNFPQRKDPEPENPGFCCIKLSNAFSISAETLSWDCESPQVVLHPSLSSLEAFEFLSLVTKGTRRKPARSRF